MNAVKKTAVNRGFLKDTAVFSWNTALTWKKTPLTAFFGENFFRGEIADFLNLNQKSEKSKNQKPQKNLVLASSPLIMSLICIKK